METKKTYSAGDCSAATQPPPPPRITRRTCEVTTEVTSGSTTTRVVITDTDHPVVLQGPDPVRSHREDKAVQHGLPPHKPWEIHHEDRAGVIVDIAARHESVPGFSGLVDQLIGLMRAGEVVRNNGVVRREIGAFLVNHGLYLMRGEKYESYCGRSKEEMAAIKHLRGYVE